MSEAQDAAGSSGARLHIVLVPGFAGFDALGQLEYYAGVTGAYRKWLERRGENRDRGVVLHYFDSLPTAGVETRAERLRTYLAKRIARGEIQPDDKIALVGHSTGGLDIRRLLFSGGSDQPQRVLQVDGGDAPETAATRPGPRPLARSAATAVDVPQSRILEAVDCLVFLSVPQWGTNIADWTRGYKPLRRAVVEGLHYAVEGGRIPHLDTALSGVLGQLGQHAHDPDLVLAAQDSIRETTAARDDPTARAAAQEAGSKLRLWLQHAVDDFAAIDDLAATAPPHSKSPAHYTADERDQERGVWKAHGIRTMSIATVARRAFRFAPDHPAKPFTLKDPRTWPNRNQVAGAGTVMDISYLCAYRACAGGPFDCPQANADEDCRDIADLDISMFDPTHLGPDGPEVGDRIEIWDNDGIVNTASMLWPDGPQTRLVAADHGDIIGHYLRRVTSPSPHPSCRIYASYDLLRSGTGFTDSMFHEVWDSVFDHCAGPWVGT